MNIYEKITLLIALGSFAMGIIAVYYTWLAHASSEAHYQAEKDSRQIVVSASSATFEYEYEDRIIIRSEFTIHNNFPTQMIIRYLGTYLQFTNSTDFWGFFFRRYDFTISIIPSIQGEPSRIGTVDGPVVAGQII